MDTQLDGTWQEFETWIKDTIGSDFRWRVRPQDTREHRKMIASLILAEIKRHSGVFPERRPLRIAVRPNSLRLVQPKQISRAPKRRRC